jgi:hypothetical protein
MPNAEHDSSLLKIGRGIRRHKGLTIGVSSLAVVVGAGGVVAAERAPGEHSGGASSSLSAPMAAEQAEIAGKPVAPAFVGPHGPTAQPSPSTLQERVADARGANERLGTTVRQPKPPANGGYVADPSRIKVVETGNIAKRRWTMRVVSAPEDLTGQRELAWVADGGKPYGDATCSQTIQMSNNAHPRTLPTLLICWRTSATRSAYTVAVNLNHRPSRATSVAALDKAWAAIS